MSSTISSPAEGSPADPAPARSQRVDVLLDQLMPRPGPAWRRFAVGLAATVMVAALGLSIHLGYLYPRPTANVSYGGNGELIHVPERGALAVSVHLPNVSNRAVRVTSVALDAPGLDLVEVAGRRPLPDSGSGSAEPVQCVEEADGIEVCTGPTTPLPPDYFAPWPTDLLDELPVFIPAGDSIELFLLVEPTACDGPSELPWGVVDVTADFGPDALPPWSTTVRIQEALVADASQARLLAADRSQVFAPQGERADATGLLAAACRLTGRS